MYVVEIVLLTCAGGLGLVLLVPLVVEARVSLPPEGGGPGLRIDAGLLGGLLGCRVKRLTSAWSLRLLVAGFPLPFINLTLGGGTPSEAEAESEPSATDAEAAGEEGEPEPDEEKKVESRGLSADIARFWKYAKMGLPPGLRLVRALPGVVSFRRVRISGSVGLADPAMTGQIYGILEGIRGSTTKLPLYIDVTPDFRARPSTGHVDVLVHLHLAYLLAVIARCGLHMAWRWSVAYLTARRWWPLPA